MKTTCPPNTRRASAHVSASLPVTAPAAADILAPVTITVTGRLAAALRFAAVLNGETPEEAAVDMIRAGTQCSIEDIEPFLGGADFETWCKGERAA